MRVLCTLGAALSLYKVNRCFLCAVGNRKYNLTTTVRTFSLSFVSCSSRFQLDLWVLSGDGESDASTECLVYQFTYVHLHGVLMGTAWGLFLPLGTLLGRYYRWTWPIWFILHLNFQVCGIHD